MLLTVANDEYSVCCHSNTATNYAPNTTMQILCRAGHIIG